MVGLGKFTEYAAVLETVFPASAGAGNADSGWVHASKFSRYAALLTAGDLGASSTAKIQLRRATDASGTGAEVVKESTASDVDNKLQVVNVDRSEVGNLKPWISIRIVRAGANASIAGGHLLGLNPMDGPASDSDDADVTEIV